MTAQNRSEIADLLSRHGLSPTKRLGQHFLADANITRKIVNVSQVDADSRVVEVGAGTGTLTSALAGAGARVVAYEIDSGLMPVLEEVTKGMDVELHFEDVMDVDFVEALEGDGWHLVANLPYNVGTPLVLEVLRHVPKIERFVIMIQREVARRLSASPGSREYGLPSVIVGIHARVDDVFSVPPQVFYPPPSVESAVVSMTRIPAPSDAEAAIELAATAFNQRRKMLRRSLANALDDPISKLDSAGISPTVRAEEVSPDGYLRLARQ